MGYFWSSEVTLFRQGISAFLYTTVDVHTMNTEYVLAVEKKCNPARLGGKNIIRPSLHPRK